MSDFASPTPECGQMEPKKLRSKADRERARCIRDGHWRFMERCATHNPLWFCVWNKQRRPELADEQRHGLLDGMEILNWCGRHPSWFVQGEWSEERYARPMWLTSVGRAALANRRKYDMEPVYGGMVEPGWQAIPLPRSAA